MSRCSFSAGVMCGGDGVDEVHDRFVLVLELNMSTTRLVVVDRFESSPREGYATVG